MPPFSRRLTPTLPYLNIFFAAVSLLLRHAYGWRYAIASMFFADHRFQFSMILRFLFFILAAMLIALLS